jgi:ribonuclease HI
VIWQWSGSDFRHALQASGVSIHDKEDNLLWIGGDSSGSLMVKNVYVAFLSTQNLSILTGWRKSLWKWDIQQKIKLFMWLAVENKILTWNNLQHRGWIGPGRCQLCKGDIEDTSHLFIHCPFTKLIWKKIKTIKKYKHEWKGNNLVECLTNWTVDKTVPSYLAALICWFIWLERNSAIFEGKEPSTQAVVIKTLGSLKKPEVSKIPPSFRSCLIAHPHDSTVACFDGATLANGKCSGAGGIIKTSVSTVYRWYFNCGEGTNTKAELMGVWATLFLANHLSIHKLQILGDSKVIIDWLNKKSELRACAIEGWKQRIRALRSKFLAISFEHIYREFNKEADLLSKKALQEPEGVITFFKWSNGLEGQRCHIKIY